MSTMVILLIAAAASASAAIGYVIRGGCGKDEIGGLLDEVNRQLSTILKHENKINALVYVAKEREKSISALKGLSTKLKMEIALLKKEQVDLKCKYAAFISK
jgi:hypothetical protein